jgi:hypothetical protein
MNGRFCEGFCMPLFRAAIILLAVLLYTLSSPSVSWRQESSGNEVENRKLELERSSSRAPDVVRAQRTCSSRILRSPGAVCLLALLSLSMSLVSRILSGSRTATRGGLLSLDRPLPTPPSHSLRWISSASPSISEPESFLPNTSKLPTTPKRSWPTTRGDDAEPPEFLHVKDRAVFTHPSYFHTPHWRFEAPTEIDGTPYKTCDYERHEASHALSLESSSAVADLRSPSSTTARRSSAYSSLR